MPSLELTLVGGPTVLVRYAGLAFLVDPTFDPPGDYPGGRPLHKLEGPALQLSDLGPIDAVLLSHDQHPDNLDTAGRRALTEAGVTYSTPAAAERIPGVVGLEPWAQAQLGPVTVTAVPALHGPEGAEAITGQVTGFVLSAAGETTVYISGDNASVDLVAGIVERHGPIGVAILFAGAANVGVFGDVDITLNRRTAIAAAEELGDSLIVPAHTDGWDHFTETGDSLARAFHYAGLDHRFLRLQPGIPTRVPERP